MILIWACSLYGKTFALQAKKQDSSSCLSTKHVVFLFGYRGLIMNCNKSYILSDEQKRKSDDIVREIRANKIQYDFIICETNFDVSVYFYPTDEEFNELEDN